jgi:hypothetical protein
MRGSIVFAAPDKKGYIIEGPPERTLFYKPGSNTHYLQTHYTKRISDELTMDDICITSQMTFSCEAHHLFGIMKQILNDSLNTIESTHATFTAQVEFIQRIEQCVNALVKEYNKTEPVYKILPTEQNKSCIASLKGYLGMIFYKLSIYINKYAKQRGSKKKYLKDMLTMNSRHTNYVLYTAAKACIREIFGKSAQKHTVSIIQKLLIQEEILKEYLLNDTTHVKEGAFGAEKVLERNTEHYGDPTHSLLSYFQFFEEPVNTDDNIRESDDGIMYYDWLEYSGVDIYSSKMDIQKHKRKKNKVLVEFRGFQHMLMPYMLSMADEDLKTNMKHGTCNVLSNRYSEDIPIASIYNLRKLLQLYDVKHGTSAGKTRKSREPTKRTKN